MNEIEKCYQYIYDTLKDNIKELEEPFELYLDGHWHFILGTSYAYKSTYDIKKYYLEEDEEEKEYYSDHFPFEYIDVSKDCDYKDIIYSHPNKFDWSKKCLAFERFIKQKFKIKNNVIIINYNSLMLDLDNQKWIYIHNNDPICLVFKDERKNHIQYKLKRNEPWIVFES